MQNEVKINQKHYGQLSVCNREQDIVQVWMSQKDDPQVIQIERENIPALIQALSASYNIKKQPDSKPNPPISRVIVFNKTPEQRWFADIPEWTGAKEDLEMVDGADRMLDLMAEGANTVTATVSNFEIGGSIGLDLFHLTKDKSEGYYSISSYPDSKWFLYREWFLIFLCEVTKVVFWGEFPKKIWISKHEY